MYVCVCVWSTKADTKITNTRISGHALAGVSILGGYDALLSNNIIADNSQLNVGAASAIEVLS